MGVETGGCPHTAIRENASMNLAAIEDMNRKFPHAELCFVEPAEQRLMVERDRDPSQVQFDPEALNPVARPIKS